MSSDNPSKKPDRDAVPPPGHRVVFARYITRNGKKIYPKKAKVFRFYVLIEK